MFEHIRAISKIQVWYELPGMQVLAPIVAVRLTNGRSQSATTIGSQPNLE